MTMKRILTISFVALVVLVAGHAISAQQQQFGGAQLAVPEIPFDSVPNFLKLPDKLYLGEVAGVATNSKGHVFVFHTSSRVSPARRAWNTPQRW